MAAWVYIIVYIFTGIVFALLSGNLANKKGYGNTTKFGWLGFFLGAFGLIYVVGLPLSPRERAEDMERLARLLKGDGK